MKLRRLALLGCILATALSSCAAPPDPSQPPTTAAATPVWSDEFNQPEGSAPDPAKWKHDLGAGGWGNNELQRYTADRANSRIVADPAATDGRALCIVALVDSTGGYTSARLTTEGRFMPRRGRIEARIRTSDGQGVWPAFWMLGANMPSVGWPACGEIDVLEALGHLPRVVHSTLHGPGYAGADGIQGRHTLPVGASMSDRYHIYAVDWKADRITWSVDDVPFFIAAPATLPPGSRWIFNDTPFYLLLNLAIGGSWPGYPDETTPFPRTLHVDYVRIYPPNPPTTPEPPSTPTTRAAR